MTRAERRELREIAGSCRWRGRARRGLPAGGKHGFRLCRCPDCVALGVEYRVDAEFRAEADGAESVALTPDGNMIFMRQSATRWVEVGLRLMGAL